MVSWQSGYFFPSLVTMQTITSIPAPRLVFQGPLTIGVPVSEPVWDRAFSVYIRGCLLLFELPSFQVSSLISFSSTSLSLPLCLYLLGSILPLDLSYFLYIHFLLCKAIESSTLPSPHSTFLPTYFPTQCAYHHASF